MTRLRAIRLLVSGASLFAAVSAAHATPSTTFWAPSTTYIQPYLVPHITYDTYFGRKGETGQALPLAPIDTGLTMGVLPFEKVNLEVGFDLLLPSEDPLLLNAKVGVPEGVFFASSPSLAVGVSNVGTKSDVTDYNMLYAQIQKNLPFGGFVSVGGYYGAGSAALWTGSDGQEHRLGFIGALVSPDINIDIPGLKKIVLMADIQTGNNVLGAVGGGVAAYFTDAISVITGPVFFLAKETQTSLGQASWLWTLQLDVDVTLFAPKAPSPGEAAPAPAPATHSN